MIHMQRNSPLARFSLLAAIFISLSSLATAQVDNGVKLFKGIVSNATTGKPIAGGGKIWVYQGSNLEPITNSKINPGTGFYQVILNPGTTYRFEFKSPSYFITSTSVTTPPGNEYEETVHDFTIDSIPVGQKIFSGRLFDPGSSQLKPTPELQKLVDLLQHEPGIKSSVTITPDALAPVTKPAPKPKAKKVKKGMPEPPPPPPAPAAFTEDQFKALGGERSVALKNFMKDKGISVTRFEWTTAAGTLLQGGSNYPENVVITIKKIEIEDE
jgi:hypothetical protein